MKIADLLSVVGLLALAALPLSADPPGDDGAIPITTFDCSYLNGFLYKRVPLE